MDIAIHCYLPALVLLTRRLVTTLALRLYSLSQLSDNKTGNVRIRLDAAKGQTLDRCNHKPPP